MTDNDVDERDHTKIFSSKSFQRSHNFAKAFWGILSSKYFISRLIFLYFYYLTKRIKFEKWWYYQINQTIWWTRDGFLKNGLNSYGANQYPIKTKLKPKFLVFLKNPLVLQLTILYKRADENAIIIDLTLMSPKVKILSCLNLLISFESRTSIPSRSEMVLWRFLRYSALIIM